MDGHAERKVVSVVFADLVGFTARAEQLDPEDVRRLLVPYYTRVRVELERFGGTVEKFIGDAVVALFGAPVAHEDDPERAVRAAFALRDAVARLNSEEDLDLHVRVGVNTGEAVISFEAEPFAAGDVINTAARLQQAAARDSILVGARTRAATEHVATFGPPLELDVKGKAAAVTASEALALKHRRRAPQVVAPLVGRRAELRTLIGAFERTRAGMPELITLLGDPGVGKSRLVWELSRVIDTERDGVCWRHGRCPPYGGDAFTPLTEIVKAEAGVLDTDSAEVAGERLSGAVSRLALGADAEWVLARLRPLLGLDPEARTPETRGESFAAWRRFLEAVATRAPLVLAIEDLHWADDVLLEFVEHVIEWIVDAPLLIVTTARAELVERRPEWPGTLVEVAPLGRKHTQHLLEELLGRDPGTELLARVAGNPLFAAEYARMGREDDDGALPPSVQAVIASRLDMLPADEKAALQHAAVVGDVFSADAVAALMHARQEDVEARLDALAGRQLVRAQARSAIAAQRQYAFRHVLVREVAYEQMTRERRGLLHERAAAWIASLIGGRVDERAEMLAHHYERALAFGVDTQHLADGARRAFVEAGDRALSLYAFRGARDWYRRALDLWPQDREHAAVLARYGRALFWAEGGGESELAQARDELLESGDRDAAVEAQVMLSRLCLSRGALDSGTELAESAVELVEAEPDSRAKTEAIANLAAFLSIAGETQRAVAVGRRAIELSDRLDLDELRAYALTQVGFSRVTLGDLDGLRDLEASVAISDALNSPESVRAFANLASVHARLGDLGRSWKLYAQARARAERFGDARGLRWLAAERVYEQYWRREWDEALAGADRLVADEGTHLEHAGRHVRASIRLARSDVSGAREDAAAALAFARVAGDAQTLYPSLALAARCALADGAISEANALLDETIALWRRSGFDLPSFWIADLAFAAIGLERARELADAAGRAAVTTRWLEAARRLLDGAAADAAETFTEIGAQPEAAFAAAAFERSPV